MNAADREQLRLSLLRYLDRDGSAVFGLPTARLHATARAEGFAADPAQTERELDYLAEKGLAAEVPKTLSPENRAWKLTAAGRDHLAQTLDR